MYESIKNIGEIYNEIPEFIKIGNKLKIPKICKKRYNHDEKFCKYIHHMSQEELNIFINIRKIDIKKYRNLNQKSSENEDLINSEFSPELDKIEH